VNANLTKRVNSRSCEFVKLTFFSDMNTTRLILNNNYDLFIPKNNTLLIYFGLPNSPILSINDDDDEMSISKSDLEIEVESNNT
jgi:hypothetical protein